MKRMLLTVNLAAFIIFLFGAFCSQAQSPDSVTYKLSLYRKLWQTGRTKLLADRLTPYQQDSIDKEKSGMKPHLFYNRDDRVFVGLNHRWVKQNEDKYPLLQKHLAYLRYSINQGAFSFGYEGLYNISPGKWNMVALANYDFVRWRNFFGLGNNTKVETAKNSFYRLRTHEVLLSVGLQRLIGKQSRFMLTPFYQHVRVLHDEGRFVTAAFFKQYSGDAYKDDKVSSAGVRAYLYLQHLDNIILPSKGTQFSLTVAPVKNINPSTSFMYYDASARFYFPLTSHFTFSMENGASTVTGSPQFYQLPTIGGSKLRGFQRDRFWGETVFYNNTELYYLFDVSGRLYKGKAGFMGFADQGRVWKSGERSNTWHRGFGGGIVLAPLHKVYFSLQYGRSIERGTINFEFRRNL